jgi:hypothetical protein
MHEPTAVRLETYSAYNFTSEFAYADTTSVSNYLIKGIQHDALSARLTGGTKLWDGF